MGKELKLNDLHQLYLRLKRGIPWFDFLLLGLFVWIEEKFINLRVTSEVDKAIESVNMPVQDCVTPVYTETYGEGSESLPKMRLKAPWYKES